MTRVTKCLSSGLGFDTRDQRGDIDQKQWPLLGFDHPKRYTLPALTHRGADRRRLAMLFNYILNQVDDQCVMMAIELDDRGFTDPVGTVG